MCMGSHSILINMLDSLNIYEYKDSPNRCVMSMGTHSTVISMLNSLNSYEYGDSVNSNYYVGLTQQIWVRGLTQQ